MRNFLFLVSLFVLRWKRFCFFFHTFLVSFSMNLIGVKIRPIRLFSFIFLEKFSKVRQNDFELIEKKKNEFLKKKIKQKFSLVVCFIARRILLVNKKKKLIKLKVKDRSFSISTVCSSQNQGLLVVC